MYRFYFLPWYINSISCSIHKASFVDSERERNEELIATLLRLVAAGCGGGWPRLAAGGGCAGIPTVTRHQNRFFFSFWKHV